MGPPIPINEPQRLEELLSLKILDTAPDPQLQSIAQIAANILDVPIALISLVDADRQWFKARVGLDVSQTSRELAFCAYAILQSEPLIVENALEDQRFASNPLVTSNPSIRFYGGAPLKTKKGHNLGTLCVIDSKPRSLTPVQEQTLQMLAALAVEMIEARERLEASETCVKLLTEASSVSEPLLSNFGHELRTPLNHIMGFADIVKRNLSPKDDERASRNREYLDIIQQSGSHLLGLIDNVIRLEQAAFQANAQASRVDVNEVLAQVAKSFTGAIGAKNQSLVFAPTETEAFAIADPTSLRQIAINLLANASKYCPVGASIEVSVYRDKKAGRICIAVEDDGPGIPDDIRDGLGRPFLRGSKAHGGGEEGFGLGLHITKRLSEAMQGSLIFEHGHHGGTRAILRLPAAGKFSGCEPRAVAS